MSSSITHFHSLPSWWIAFRPKTLWAAICPVSLGAALALRVGTIDWFVAITILVTAMLIQIATNLANDLIDARKGTDTEKRVGPQRVVQAGLLTELAVSRALVLLLLTALVLGSFLVTIGGWPILLIGSVALLCTIWYSAGPAALSYSGLADIFVFVFFGPIAVSGTAYLLLGIWSWEIACIGIAPGLISVAILTANNLRDFWTDREVNKKTLVVRFGLLWGRIEYTVCLAAACSLPLALSTLFVQATAVASLTILFALPLIWKVWKAVDAQQLAPLLPSTAKLLIIYTILFLVGLFV